MPKHQPKVMERGQLKALLSAPSTRTLIGKRNRVIMELMANCGLRLDEVCTVPLDSVRWSDGILCVRGKGGKDRCVPMHPKTMDLIKEYLDSRACDSEYLVSAYRGQKLCKRYVQKMIKRMAKKSCLPDWVTPHTLRHTYATQLLDEGFTIRQVQDLLGHASIQTTMIYTHVSPVELREKIVQRDI